MAEGGGGVESHRFQLWFEQFRDIALMALALAGGGITLLGSIFATTPKKASAFISIVFFAASAVTALFAQTRVVELADRGEYPGRDMHRLRSIAFGLIAAGCSAFLTFAFTALQRMQAP
jgi:hypothetical protein